MGPKLSTTLKDFCVTNADETPADWPPQLGTPDQMDDGQMLCLCSGDQCNDDPAGGGSSALAVTLPLLSIAAVMSTLLNSRSTL